MKAYKVNKIGSHKESNQITTGNSAMFNISVKLLLLGDLHDNIRSIDKEQVEFDSCKDDNLFQLYGSANTDMLAMRLDDSVF